jgi:hypothetical protein
MRRAARARAATALTLLLALLLTACADRSGAERAGEATDPPSGPATSPVTGAAATPTDSASGSPSAAEVTATPSGAPDTDSGDYAVADPGALKPPLLTPDVLVTSSKTIPDSVREAITKVTGVREALPLSLASLSANGRTLSIAAADPGTFRRFTAPQSAGSDEVWSRVAGGEVAVDPALPRKLEQPSGYLHLGTSADAPDVHIGAYAPLVKQISAVVNYKRGEQLGIPRDNALLISTGLLTPSKVIEKLKKAAGPDVTMQTLALEFNVDVLQTAVLSGSSVSDAVGTFTYTPHANGTITPQSSWVRSYIRTEKVPILGSVTCNKGMLPQLRAALTDIVNSGLAAQIHPGEYAGCYYPRFIANDPGKGLSLHSWGIAVDLNVPGNQRGTVGQMDRRVVAIFKKWGFAWGGDWNYTDPMHFEMAKVVQVG